MPRDPFWNHNTHYHPLALRNARGSGSALDVGCGEGLLVRRLRTAGVPRGTWEHGSPVVDPVDGYGDVRRAARAILPGVRWRRRLYWRYSLEWRRPL